MKQYSLHKVLSMPAEAKPDSIYLIKSGDKFSIKVTDAQGNVIDMQANPPIKVVSQAEYDALGDVSNDPTIYMIKNS